MKKLVLGLVALSALSFAASAMAQSAQVGIHFNLDPFISTTSAANNINLGTVTWNSGLGTSIGDVTFQPLPGSRWKYTASPDIFTSEKVGKLSWRTNIPITASLSSTGLEKWNGNAWVPADHDNAYFLEKFLKYDVALEQVSWGKNEPSNLPATSPGTHVFWLAQNQPVGFNLTPSVPYQERDSRAGTWYILPRLNVPADKTWDQLLSGDFDNNVQLEHKASPGSFEYQFIGANAGSYRDVITLTVTADTTFSY